MLFDALLRGGDPHRPVAGVDQHGRPSTDASWPLFLAAMRHVKDVATLDRLLVTRPDLSVGNRYGQGALHIAARHSDSVAVIDRLLDLGVDVNAMHQPTFSAAADGDTGPPWETPLICAIHQPNTAIVARLLARGADPNAANPHGYTALRFCKEAPERAVHCDMLIAAGAKLKLPPIRRPELG